MDLHSQISGKSIIYHFLWLISCMRSSAVNRIADKLSSGDSPLTVNNNNNKEGVGEIFHREYISSVVSVNLIRWITSGS